MREDTAARREADTRAAISAHAAKVVEEYGPLTPEQVADLRPVFADVTMSATAPRRQGRAS